MNKMIKLIMNLGIAMAIAKTAFDIGQDVGAIKLAYSIINDDKKPRWPSQELHPL